MSIDLDSLPPPEMIEPLDYETILAVKKADVVANEPQLADVMALESEPTVKITQAIAYWEMMIRARINAAVRSNLLAFADGGDLDHLAAFYGLTRIENETDARFRRRITLQIAAIAGNGTQERYASIAMTADPNVIDAAVLSQQPGSVDIAVWVSDYPAHAPLPPSMDYETANAERHAAALAAVQSALDAPNVRMLGVTLAVYEAVPHAVDVVGVIVREDTAPINLVETLAARLPRLIAQHAQLGRDVAHSLILSWLHVAGVSRVELTAPADDLTIPRNGYAVAGNIALTDGGLAW